MEFQCSKHLNTSHLPSVTEHVMSEVYSEEVLHATFIQNKQIEISSVMRAINDKHTHHVHMQTLPHTHTHTHTHARARVCVRCVRCVCALCALCAVCAVCVCAWLPLCTPTNTWNAVSFIGCLDNANPEMGDPQMSKIRASPNQSHLNVCL